MSTYVPWILLVAALVGCVNGSAQDNTEYLFKESVLDNPRLLSRGQKYDPEMPSKCSICTTIWYDIKLVIPAGEHITKEILYYLAHKFCDKDFPLPGVNQVCHKIFETMIDEVWELIIKAGGAINPETLCTFAHLCPDTRIVEKYLDHVRNSYNRYAVY